jgi:hypothetical protein
MAENELIGTTDFVKDLRKETQGYTDDLLKMGKAVKEQFGELKKDLGWIGGGAGRVFQGAMGAFAPIQVGMASSRQGYVDTQMGALQFQAFGKTAKAISSASRGYSQQLALSEVAKSQGLVEANASTRAAAAAAEKNIVNMSKAMQSLNVEARVATKGLDAFGKGAQSVGKMLDISPLKIYEATLESLGQTGTRVGSAMMKAFTPFKYAFSGYATGPLIAIMELGKALDEARKIEAELADRNNAIGKLLGVSTGEAGAIVRQYAGSLGTTQHQAQQSVAGLAARGFSGREIGSIANQVEYTSRRAGITRQEALQQRVESLDRALIGLSGSERARVFGEVSVRHGGLSGRRLGDTSIYGYGLRRYDREQQAETAQRYLGNVPSIYQGIKERVAYGLLGRDPYGKGLVAKAREAASDKYEGFKTAVGWADKFTPGVNLMGFGSHGGIPGFSDIGSAFSDPGKFIDKFTGGAFSDLGVAVGPTLRSLARNRYATRAFNLETDSSYTDTQKTFLQSQAMEGFFKIRMQEEEEHLGKMKGHVSSMRRLQGAAKAERDKRDSENEITSARERLAAAESSGTRLQ